jgi:hypothetical protein
MPNFYTDNPDIRFYLKNMDLSEIIRLRENGFRERELYDYAPSDEADALDNYDRVLSLLGEIAGERIAMRAPEVDKEGTHFENGKVTYAVGIAKDIDELAQADLMGFTLPRKYGGLNLPSVAYTMGIEMVSRADASLMTVFGLQDIAETINAFADDEIKNKYLPLFCKGTVTGAMVLTEPDAGSDLQAVSLRATEDPENGCWHLNGVKRFISNGNGHILLVMARSEPGTRDARGLSLFVCEADETVKIRRIEDKMGIKGSPTCEMQFVNTRARLIGKRRLGLIRYVMSLMNGARLGIAGQALGIAEACVREAIEYAESREQFGKKIKEFPAVAAMLVNMKVTTEAMRAFTYKTASVVDLEHLLGLRLDSGEVTDKEELQRLKERQASYRRYAAMLTPMAKYFTTERVQTIATDNIQIHGGSGFMKDYDAERHFRDARITNIYEGTTQLQVVAAIGGIRSGAYKSYVEEEVARIKDRVNPHSLEKILDRYGHFLTALEMYKAQQPDYQDLHAQEVVEAATLLITDLALIEFASRSEHKRAVAEKFTLDSLADIDRAITKILSGDRIALDKMGQIITFDSRQ